MLLFVTWVIAPILNTGCGKTQLHFITVTYFLQFLFAFAGNGVPSLT